jgi:large subunit ribosomal protein L13Ae
MFEKEVVIDGRGHLLGRLASYVAKDLLSGQRIVVVRCEEILKSASLFRSKMYRQETMGKHINTNRRRGHKHWKAPSRIFWKVVRGMLPHKEAIGAAALGRLRVFEGIPFPYDHKKRMVVPDALKCLRMKPSRPFCNLGKLAEQTGWKKKALITSLEAKRKVKSSKFHELKVRKQAARAKAMGDKTVEQFNKQLAAFGF